MKRLWIAAVLMASLAVSQEPEKAVTDTLEETADTTAQVAAPAVPSEADTAVAADTEPAALTLEEGYKTVPWGTPPDDFSSFVKADSMKQERGREGISVHGWLGEDSVLFVYAFSDKGFWKVRIDYQVGGDELDDYMDHFSRIERVLTKRYGAPVRTTQNEMGTDREYLFSDFPKLSRAYFRSSWKVEPVRIELLLEAVVDRPDEELPVFDDLIPLLRLYYYHPAFYGQTPPDTSEVSEETLLDAY